MSKIKLINYPYEGHKVGEICDFGEEKNASMVSLRRAVYWDPVEIKKNAKKVEKEKRKAMIKSVLEPEPEKLANQGSSESKEETITEDQPVTKVTKQEKSKEVKPEPKKAKSFWDRLK